MLRGMKRIAVYCGSNKGVRPEYATAAEQLGTLLAREKIELVYGGGMVGFDAYLWRFGDGKPIVNQRKSMKEVPARTEISDAMSKDLLRRGFKLVGSTICYANMQAVGMVNDHLVTCFRHKECGVNL